MRSQQPRFPPPDSASAQTAQAQGRESLGSLTLDVVAWVTTNGQQCLQHRPAVSSTFQSCL
eukprot:12678002-Alexandrium_andersonii.AAC.1